MEEKIQLVLEKQKKFFEEGRTLNTGYRLEILKKLRSLEPQIRTGVLFVGCPVDPPALAQAADAEALVLNYQYVTLELAQAARQAGLIVAVWNIDAIADLLPVLPLDLDYIGSNAPDILIKYLRSVNK